MKTTFIQNKSSSLLFQHPCDLLQTIISTQQSLITYIIEFNTCCGVSYSENSIYKSNSIYNQQNHGSKVKIKLFLSIWVLVLMSKFAMSIFVSIA